MASLPNMCPSRRTSSSLGKLRATPQGVAFQLPGAGCAGQHLCFLYTLHIFCINSLCNITTCIFLQLMIYYHCQGDGDVGRPSYGLSVVCAKATKKNKKIIKNPLTNRTRCAIMSTSRGELLKTKARYSGQQKLHELKPRPDLPVDHTHSEVVKQDGAVDSRWGTETNLLSRCERNKKKVRNFFENLLTN